VGSATPQAIAYYVREMKKILRDIPIEIHVHNDFGLAMANTVAAVAAGAEVISTTINGVGERSGNTATEEAALTLQMLYGIDLGIDCSLLKETSDLVQELSGVHLAQNKAVVGTNCFAHESGLAVAGMKNMPFTSEAYSPELVGQTSRIVLGKKSGRSSIEQVMAKHGIAFEPEDVVNLLAWVKSTALATKKSVSDEAFLEMCNAFCQKIVKRRG
jgi:isopropylmalate/homocitrate/citramalate synthase